jgi:hypothetical protein
MAKVQDLFEVTCPCCDAVLKIDRATSSVIAHKQPEKPPAIEDLAAAVQRLKGDAGRREEAFQKSFADHQKHGKVLESKFDELLRQAKESPDQGPPKRAFDLD